VEGRQPYANEDPAQNFIISRSSDVILFGHVTCISPF